MKLKRTVILRTIVAVSVFLGLLHFSSRARKIKNHLNELEYWERVLFDRTSKNEEVSLYLRRVFSGRDLDPAPQIEKALIALTKLGYLTNQTFLLEAPVTNRQQHAAFNRLVKNTIFIDSHWNYSISSNQLKAMIHPPDAPVWSNIVMEWNQKVQAVPAPTNAPGNNY